MIFKFIRVRPHLLIQKTDKSLIFNVVSYKLIPKHKLDVSIFLNIKTITNFNPRLFNFLFKLIPKIIFHDEIKSRI